MEGGMRRVVVGALRTFTSYLCNSATTSMYRGNVQQDVVCTEELIEVLLLPIVTILHHPIIESPIITVAFIIAISDVHGLL